MKSGDIFLVRGNGKFSTILTTVQKVFYRGAQSSHILINIAEGTFVHATTDGGIDIVFFEEILPEIHASWRAVRLKGLTQNHRDEIIKAAIYYYQQGYNYKYFMKENNHTSFCSELVSKIYIKAGIEIFDNKKPNKTIPADFDKACDTDTKWEEVTDEFKTAIAKMNESISDYRISFTILLMSIKKRQFMLKRWSDLYKVLDTMTEQGTISKSFYEDAVKRENEFLEHKNISFWDED